MSQKKSVKGDIENRKKTFFTLGIVLVLSLVYVCFELFATTDKGTVINLLDGEYINVLDEDVIATDQTPPPPPPPVQQQKEVVLNVVEDIFKVNTNWELLNQEYREDDVITELVPIENVQEEVDDTPPVRYPEESPEFIGGMEALYAFLQKELVYPEIARNNGIQGVVLLEFVVEKDGSVSNVKVMVSLYPDCDYEAMRVVKKLPNWKPGKSMGKPVRSIYNIPIRFTLQ